MYNIAIKIEGIENRKRRVGVLHIIVGFYLLIKAGEYSGETSTTWLNPAVPILLVAVTSLVYGFFRRRFDILGKYNFWLRLLQIITLIFLGIYEYRSGADAIYNTVFFIWSGLFLVMMILERRIFADTDIRLKADGIIIPGLYKDHHLTWNELEDVIIRHDFITIFNKNQKYLQYQILQDLSELEVAKMNAFCKEKLESK